MTAATPARRFLAGDLAPAATGLGCVVLFFIVLETLIRTDAVNWNPEQRGAAVVDLTQARAQMRRDLLALAQDAFARPAPAESDPIHVLHNIDCVEAELMPGDCLRSAMHRRGRG